MSQVQSARHSLRLTEDADGWDVPTCSCGWIGPPCPGKEEAAEFYGDHRISS